MTAATTLVVDDEPVVRHLVRRILEPRVCNVVEVEDGESALRLIQRRADSIDVVLTDLAMPGIDGFDVVDVLARHLPELPVLCMSGHAAQLNAGRRLTVPFIHKPFTADALCEAVVPLIERSRAWRAAERARQQAAAAADLVAEAKALRAARAKPGGPR